MTIELTVTSLPLSRFHYENETECPMTLKPTRLAALSGAASGSAALAIAGFAPAFAIVKPKGLHVIADFVSKPENVDAVRKLLVPAALSALKEPGCMQHVLLEIQGDPGHFMTYEVWADHAALNVHSKVPALVASGSKLVPLLAKPSTQLLFDALA